MLNQIKFTDAIYVHSSDVFDAETSQSQRDR